MLLSSTSLFCRGGLFWILSNSFPEGSQYDQILPRGHYNPVRRQRNRRFQQSNRSQKWTRSGRHLLWYSCIHLRGQMCTSITTAGRMVGHSNLSASEQASMYSSTPFGDVAACWHHSLGITTLLTAAP